MKFEGSNITFSSGRKIYAHRGIFGIAPRRSDGWEITNGYDSSTWHEALVEYDMCGDALTKAELVELADGMIDLWRQFREFANAL